MRVRLFIPCLVDTFTPHTGLHMARLLRRAGVDVDVPDGQTCCGQPAFNSGHHDEARPVAERFVALFGPDGAGEAAAASDEPITVVTPSGSCAAMVRVHYRDLGLAPEIARAAERIEVREFSEFMANTVGADRIAGSLPARIVYHPSCHALRELGVRTEPLTLLERIDGLEVVPIDGGETCCGFGGKFSVDFPELSTSMGSDKCDAIEAADVDYVVSTDAGCLLQLGGLLRRRGARTRAVHLVDILAHAAGLLANDDLGATYSR